MNSQTRGVWEGLLLAGCPKDLTVASDEVFSTESLDLRTQK